MSASVRSNEWWELGVRLCSSALGTRAACKLQLPLFPHFFKSPPGSPIKLRCVCVCGGKKKERIGQEKR